MALTEAQQEAAELATAIIDFAQGLGWDIEKKGVNKTYAWVRLTHPWHHGLQAFYAVDPEETDDKFIYGSVVIPMEALKPIVKAASTADIPEDAEQLDLAPDTAEALRKCYALGDATPVPPTGAAHRAAHRAAHTAGTLAVPPTGGTVLDGLVRVLPPTVEEAQSAAHTRALNDAAHDAGEVPVPPTMDDDVPPIGGGGYKLIRRLDENDDIHPDELDREDLMEARQEAKKHLEQAGQPAAQLDTIAAVEAQYASARNWSPVASPLTHEELIAKVPGKTIVFRNRQSGRIDEATVCTNAEAKRYTPKVTPEGFDPEAANEDLRIIHFLQLGAGFRSIAVSQITEIN
ncbi:hypothetical protein [Nocardia phage NC1]|nr:hypothetical protein [Nocardia phage NC1]QSL67701.1 hypothetical protein [Nocardia phage P69]